jgi:hypothetical protein
MSNKTTVINHLLDVIYKVELEWRFDGQGFYDDFDGNPESEAGMDGEAEFRNTPALLESLRALYHSLKDNESL